MVRYLIYLEDVNLKTEEYTPPLLSDVEIDIQFDNYIKSFNKSYKSHDEHLSRRYAFMKSLQRFAALNARRRSKDDAIFGVTRFSDMTPEHFQEEMLLHQPMSLHSFSSSYSNDSVNHFYDDDDDDDDSEFDWRKHKPNVITAVKNQMSCGGCYAFATASIVESAWAIAGHKLETLSPQQIISCSNNKGCAGGNLNTAIEYVEKFGLEKEHDYPFVSQNGGAKPHCNFKNSSVISSIVSHKYVLEPDEKKMRSYLKNHGPIAVGVDATVWQDYVSGVIQHHCGWSLNHAVVIVGYRTVNGVRSWIVRNSWGPLWGLDGYILIKRDNNICGIAKESCVITDCKKQLGTIVGS